MENELRPSTYGVRVAINPASGRKLPPSAEPTAIPCATVAVAGGAQSVGTGSSVGYSYDMLGVGGGSPPGPSAPKRARKERQPNWNAAEIVALIDAKRNLFIEEVDAADGRELMTPDAGKWRRISVEVMKSAVCQCIRDGPACKSKWNQLIPEYKRIIDFHARTGTNVMSYWNLLASRRRAKGLPRSFVEDIFFHIQEWYGKHPTVLPPHSRDLLSIEDRNYRTTATGIEDNDDEDESVDVNDNSFPTMQTENTNDFTRSTRSPLMQLGSAKDRTLMGSPRRPVTASGSPFVLPKNYIPTSVMLVYVSSSHTEDSSGKLRSASTGVRRKVVSGHNVIAEATRATGDAVASQMKQIVDASLLVEKCKIDVQKELFSQQMEYQRDCDRRLHDNARITNDTTKLAIQKQSEVVYCLTQLSTVLGSCLQLRQPPMTINPGQTEVLQSPPPKASPTLPNTATTSSSPL